MAKKEIFLEDAVLDDLSEGLDIVESPLSGTAFKLVGWVLSALLILFFGRAFYFQFIKGFEYQSRALANAGQQTVLKAPRGIIYDRYNKALVSNEPSFNLTLNLSELLKNKENIRKYLENISAIVPFDVDSMQQEIGSVDLERQAYLTLARNVPLAEIIDLKKLNLKALIIENSYIRTYQDGSVFSHIIGYTGLVSRKDLDRDENLLLNDEVGKTGLEAFYDKYLRGVNGVAISYQDAKGNLLESKNVNEPQGGDGVLSTVDSDLQKFFYSILKDQLSSLGRVAGAGLVMDPNNGEVLSMVSLPSYDNNKLTSDLFVDKNRPTFNRVVSGIYSPGSTIKPLMAFAALEEGIIDPLKEILSIGYIEIPNPYFPDKPSRFVDWKAHGWVNMYSALARSSNVYFYEVGGGFQNLDGLGIYRLQDYWKKFKLDQKTGIDLPGEETGVLADPEIKENRSGEIWRVGDTYNVSIGQGDFRITPTELLRYISSIATDGYLPIPHLVKEIKDYKGNIVYKNESSLESVETKDKNHFSDVRRGMLDGVRKDYGTSHALSDIPMEIAGKTGSAQIQNNQKTNAFFVGFNMLKSSTEVTEAIAEKIGCKLESNQCTSVPQQIAVLVLIEDAKEGSLNAVPVAKKIFQWYYENRINK